MADYIDKNILCEAYIHIEPKNLAEGKESEYLDQLLQFATKRARFFLYGNVELELRHKPGSLTVYVTVLGTIGALYKGIQGYPKFRDGVIAIFDDVKRLGETVIAEGLFSAKARREQILRLEARAGVVGSLRNIVGLLESIKSDEGGRGAPRLVARIKDTEEAAHNLLTNLKTAEDREFVRTGLKQLAEELPDEPRSGRKKRTDGAQVKAYKAAKTSLCDYLSKEAEQQRQLPKL